MAEIEILDDPFALFLAWLEDAKASEINDPTALALATADGDGLPDLRMVLLKGCDARGFVFYTNYESAKGGQLLAHPKAAMLFHWKSLRRQVRVRGDVERGTAAEADAYFASRPYQSQIASAASRQSRPLKDRAEYEAAVDGAKAAWPEAPVPRPPQWAGFRLVPRQIEFWLDGAYRMHHRLVYRRAGPAAPWTTERLYP